MVHSHQDCKLTIEIHFFEDFTLSIRILDLDTQAIQTLEFNGTDICTSHFEPTTYGLISVLKVKSTSVVREQFGLIYESFKLQFFFHISDVVSYCIYMKQ